MWCTFSSPLDRKEEENAGWFSSWEEEMNAVTFGAGARPVLQEEASQPASSPSSSPHFHYLWPPYYFPSALGRNGRMRLKCMSSPVCSKIQGKLRPPGAVTFVFQVKKWKLFTSFLLATAKNKSLHMVNYLLSPPRGNALFYSLPFVFKSRATTTSYSSISLRD